MNGKPRLRTIISGRLPIASVSAATVLSVMLAVGQDARWIGHSILGVTALILLAATVVHGAGLAGRIKIRSGVRSARGHRNSGMVMGLLMLETFAYGVWMLREDSPSPVPFTD